MNISKVKCRNSLFNLLFTKVVLDKHAVSFIPKVLTVIELDIFNAINPHQINSHPRLSYVCCVVCV